MKNLLKMGFCIAAATILASANYAEEHQKGQGPGRGPGGPGDPGGPGFEGRGEMPIMGMLSDLNLTDEQMSKVKEIIKKQKDSGEASRESMRAVHEKLRDLASAETFNEAEVRKLAQQIADAQSPYRVCEVDPDGGSNSIRPRRNLIPPE